MAGPLFKSGVLAFKDGKLLFDAGNGFYCCCVLSCPCCTRNVLAVSITIGGIGSFEGCEEGDCDVFDGTYAVPADDFFQCVGFETFSPFFACGLLDGELNPLELDALVSWLITCVEEIDGSVTLTLTVDFQASNFFDSHFETTVNIPADTIPVDCSTLSGPMTLISNTNHEPLYCDGDAITCNATVILA